MTTILPTGLPCAVVPLGAVAPLASAPMTHAAPLQGTGLSTPAAVRAAAPTFGTDVSGPPRGAPV